VILAVQTELTCNFDFGPALRGECALQLSRSENNFRELATLEDFAMHFSISSIVAAFSAGCVHDDVTANRARYRVKSDYPALEFEVAMNCMERGVEFEFDFLFAPDRIEPSSPARWTRLQKPVHPVQQVMQLRIEGR